MLNLRVSIGAFAAVVMACAAAWANQPANEDPAAVPFRNPALSFEERARDLVGRMTLEEKAHQLGHTAPALVAGEVKVWVGGGQPLSRAGRAAPAGIATKFTLSDYATLPR